MTARQEPSRPAPLQSSIVLERRLTDGWTRIEEAIAGGEDVTAWESFWIQLLREYEQACDIESILAGWD